MITRDKIRGLFLGVAIGDALGMFFESKKYEDIKNTKRLKGYRGNRRGKKGTWTDDTQLTLATALAMIESGKFDMDNIAKWHVKAYKETTSGWGGTTRDAIKKISEGEHWASSGEFVGQENRGFGNGVPMKVAPLAAYFALTKNYSELNKILVDFTAMTHQTSIAVSSCHAHVTALMYCLNTTVEDFRAKEFLEKVITASCMGRAYYTKPVDDITDKLAFLLKIYDKPTWLFDDEYLVKEFGGGTCYVYNSLPFSYAFFLRGPFSIDTLYDVAYAGGDADTNASFVASMLGAICGTTIFPKLLVEGLQDKSKIIKIADLFYESFTNLRICAKLYVGN